MREALAALVALVRLLARVEPHVLDQVVFVFEGLAADAALVGPLPCRREEGKLFPIPLLKNIGMLLKISKTWGEKE